MGEERGSLGGGGEGGRVDQLFWRALANVSEATFRNDERKNTKEGKKERNISVSDECLCNVSSLVSQIPKVQKSIPISKMSLASFDFDVRDVQMIKNKQINNMKIIPVQDPDQQQNIIVIAQEQQGLQLQPAR